MKYVLFFITGIIKVYSANKFLYFLRNNELYFVPVGKSRGGGHSEIKCGGLLVL